MPQLPPAVHNPASMVQAPLENHAQSFSFHSRDETNGRQSTSPQYSRMKKRQGRWCAGPYIKRQPCDCSTHGSKQQGVGSYVLSIFACHGRMRAASSGNLTFLLFRFSLLRISICPGVVHSGSGSKNCIFLCLRQIVCYDKEVKVVITVRPLPRGRADWKWEAEDLRVHWVSSFAFCEPSLKLLSYYLSFSLFLSSFLARFSSWIHLMLPYWM